MENQNGNTREETAYEHHGHRLRAEIKDLAEDIKDFIQLSKDTTPAGGDDSERQNHSEMIANATIAYRKLEDARMRIGKCLQAHGGGVSILDQMRDEQKDDPCHGALPTPGDAANEVAEPIVDECSDCGDQCTE